MMLVCVYLRSAGERLVFFLRISCALVFRGSRRVYRMRVACALTQTRREDRPHTQVIAWDLDGEGEQKRYRI
jgi:hypothetical protein